MTDYRNALIWVAGQYCWFLLLVPVVVCLILLRFRYTQQTVALLTHPKIMLLANVVPLWRWIARAVLLTVGFLCLVVALMRPCFEGESQKIYQAVRDVFIVLDISRSMLACDDETGNRLSQAKKKITSLIDHLAGERIGLILFSGSAFVHCPLTTDYEAFRLFLNAVDVETISTGTTAIDSALKKTMEAFDQTAHQKSKLVILFTDGEDFSLNLEGFKQKAQENNILIFTCGLGSKEGAPIPVFDAQSNQIGHQKNATGSIVISRLNEPMLQDLATQLGGFYCSPQEHDMKKIAQAIERFEKERIVEKDQKQLVEHYHYLLMGAFFCFALEWLC
jgi:Ca-activated chloride channel family protein